MMRIIATVLFLAGSLLAPRWSYGQDLLVNPQNQKYLFTAGTDETQAFLYNPAYLGLFDRGSVLDAYYFYPSRSRFNLGNESFHDIGVFGQGGKLGLAYRNAATSAENLNQYSMGLGFGDQRFAAGVSLSLMDITGAGSRWFPSVGLIWRPDRYVSLGAAYHNFSKVSFGFHPIEKTANFGIGIRPFGTEFLTLNADLISPRHNDGYKVGVAVEPIPGLRVYGIYDRSGYGYGPVVTAYPASSQFAPSSPITPLSMWGRSSISVGVSFNFGPHIRAEGASSYESGGYAATYGRVMLASQDLKTVVPGGRIAEIVIRGSIPDAPEPWFPFVKAKKTLLSYVEEIRKCGNDQSVKALVLKIYPFSTSGTFFALSGETQELADAVEYVREKGKKVFAYLTDDSGVDELYLASAADKIYMAPVAFISGYGIDFDLIRLKGLFDKLHITWNAQTAGKYKSTFHTIYTDSASPEQAKLIRGLVDDIYSQMLKQIEVNRRITMGDSLRSEISGIISSRMAVQLHFIDGVAYYDQFKEDVSKDVLGSANDRAFADPASIHKYETRWGGKPEIAVIGVYGTIMTGESFPPSPFPIPFFGSDRVTGSETVVRQINAAADDNDIKAIVLRVNSGGGSALASDEIYNAIKEARKKKPVVASFGNMAASGGYYVAVGVQKIFAEPATLTGSIGVVIAFPVLTDFLEKDLGGNVEKYRAGENSDLLSPFHRWDENDLKYVDQFLNETYNDFKAKVAEGRKLSLARVDELAQGKVYTGAQAKGSNLIDDYGGLEKAIRYAADVAGISDGYRIRMFTVPGARLGGLLRLGGEILFGTSD